MVHIPDLFKRTVASKANQPLRRQFYDLLVAHMQRQGIDWSRLNTGAKEHMPTLHVKSEEFYPLNRRLVGHRPLRVQDIVAMATVLGLTGDERDTFLLLGCMVDADPRLLDLVQRRVRLPRAATRRSGTAEAAA